MRHIVVAERCRFKADPEFTDLIVGTKETYSCHRLTQRTFSSSLPSTTATLIMFSRQASRALSSQSRLFSTTAARQTKVAVLGAGGGIGQPLSLLLKTDPLVSSLSLYDIRGAPGVAADVSHVDTASKVWASLAVMLMLFLTLLRT